MNAIEQKAFAALSPAAREMALRDRRFAGEIDIAGAWLAEHDGLSVSQFLSKQRNARRPLRNGPDRLNAVDLSDLHSLEASDAKADDPLQTLLAQEYAAQLMGCEDVLAELSRIDELDELARVDVGAEARAAGLTRRAILYRLASKRDSISRGQLALAFE